MAIYEPLAPQAARFPMRTNRGAFGSQMSENLRIRRDQQQYRLPLAFAQRVGCHGRAHLHGSNRPCGAIMRAHQLVQALDGGVGVMLGVL